MPLTGMLEVPSKFFSAAQADGAESCLQCMPLLQPFMHFTVHKSLDEDLQPPLSRRQVPAS